MPAYRYRLGTEVHDLTTRTLVMGILNRTPDSFYDHGATFELDSLLRRAEVLVEQGADILDVGGVKAGPGPAVDEAEELDRVVSPIEALHHRFDVAISCDTWRASVLDAACGVGAVVGNDISGFGDPAYLDVAARHGASVVATHIRLEPRVPDPEPHYDDLVADVTAFLLERAARRGEGGPRSRADRARRRARPRQVAGAERGAAARERRARATTASRCSCRRPTSGSSVSCSSSSSTAAAPRRWRRSPTASRTDVASCGSTTSPVRSRCAA